MTVFKVGDRVKIIKYNRNSLGTVTSIRGEYFMVEEDEGTQHGSWLSTSLRLIDDVKDVVDGHSEICSEVCEGHPALLWRCQLCNDTPVLGQVVVKVTVDGKNRYIHGDCWSSLVIPVPTSVENYEKAGENLTHLVATL